MLLTGHPPSWDKTVIQHKMPILPLLRNMEASKLYTLFLHQVCRIFKDSYTHKAEPRTTTQIFLRITFAFGTSGQALSGQLRCTLKGPTFSTKLWTQRAQQPHSFTTCIIQVSGLPNLYLTMGHTCNHQKPTREMQMLFQHLKEMSHLDP